MDFVGLQNCILLSSQQADYYNLGQWDTFCFCMNISAAQCDKVQEKAFPIFFLFLHLCK